MDRFPVYFAPQVIIGKISYVLYMFRCFLIECKRGSHNLSFAAAIHLKMNNNHLQQLKILIMIIPG